MTPANPKGTRILVVDDDRSIRQLVCTIVQREGYTVDSAADGAEAIELLKHTDYTVILCDLMMPRVDGFGVIDFIKHHPHEPKPIVLIITAYADQKFKQVDPVIVAGVVRKPFEVLELGKLIRLCASGLQNEAQHNLALSSDRAIRDFVRTRGENGSGSPAN